MPNKTSWIILIFILIVSSTILGYFWNQEKEHLLTPMAIVALGDAENIVGGPTFFGQMLFISIGLFALLYTLGAAFIVGNRKLRFPLLVLTIGIGYAIIIKSILGITALWAVPIMLLLAILIAVYWILYLFPQE